MDSADALIARLRRNPGDTEAYSALKDFFGQRRDYAGLARLIEGWAARRAVHDEAADAYTEAAEVVLEGLGDAGWARRLLDQALGHQPLHARASQRLEQVLENLGELVPLADKLESRIRALEANGGSADELAAVHYRLGKLLNEKLGRSDRALQHYRRAFELDPQHLSAIYEARDIYLAGNDLSMAARLYDLEARGEGDANRRAALLVEGARLRAEHLGERDEAIARWEAALEAMPGDTHVMHELAGQLVQRAQSKDTGARADDLSRAADLYCSVAQAVGGADAVAYLEAALDCVANHDASLTMLESTAAHDPALQGRLALRWVAYLERAPDDAQAQQRRLWLAQAYADAGQHEDAATCLEPLLARGHAEARRLLASFQSGEAPASKAPPSKGKPQRESPPTEGPGGRPEEQGYETVEAAALEEVHASPGVTARPGAPGDAGNDGPTAGPGTSLPGHQAAEVARPPVSRIQQLRLAVAQLTAAGREEEAAAYCREVLEEAPGDADAFAFLDGYYRRHAEHAKLRDLLVLSANASDISAEGRKRRLREAAAISERKLGDLDAAIEVWQRLLAFDPGDAEASDTLGRLLEQTARWDALVALLEREALSAGRREDQVHAWRRIAAIHAQHRHAPEAAVIALREVCQLAPEDGQARAELTTLLLGLERFEEAAALLEQQVEAATDVESRLALLRQLAELREARLGDPEGAYAASEAVVELRPGDAEALDRMERIATQSGRSDRLVDVLGRRVHHSEGQARAALLVRMADVMDREIGDLESSIRHLRDALEVMPGDDGLADKLADAMERAAQFGDLVELLRERVVLSREPVRRAVLYRRMARVLGDRLGDEAEAQAAWLQLLEIQEDEEALRFLQAVAIRQDDLDALDDCLRRLALLSSDAVETRKLLMERARVLAVRLERPRDAIQVLQQVVREVDPGYAPASAELLRLCEVQGDETGIAEALECQLAIEAAPAARAPIAQRLADLYEGPLADPSRAIQSLQAWLAADPSAHAAQERLCQALEAQGRHEELLPALDRLAELTPDPGEAGDILVRAADVARVHLDDVQAAWNRLGFLLKRGHAPAETRLHDLARESGREEALAGIYVAMAQAPQAGPEAAMHWASVAQIYERYLGDPGRALEAALRWLALDLDDRERLAEVERLASQAGAWSRLWQVYDRLVKHEADVDDRVVLLLRHARLLEEQAADASAALDRVLQAFALRPADRGLLARVEALSVVAGRQTELMAAYERAAAVAEQPASQLKLWLRAAGVMHDRLDDRARALDYLDRALQLAGAQGERIEEVFGLAETLDAQRSAAGEGAQQDAEPLPMQRGLVRSIRRAIDAGWEGARVLALRGARLLGEPLSDPDAAFELLLQATQQMPSDAALHDRLEELGLEQGRVEALDRHLAALIDQALDSDTAVELLSRRASLLDRSCDRPSEAADVYGRLLQIRPSAGEAAQRWRACLRRAQRHQDLLVAIDRELHRGVDPAEQVALLKESAEIWERDLHNRYEARDVWKKLLRLVPDDKEAQRAVARLEHATRRPSLTDDLLFADDAETGEPQAPLPKVPGAPPVPEDERAPETGADAPPAAAGRPEDDAASSVAERDAEEAAVTGAARDAEEAAVAAVEQDGPGAVLEETPGPGQDMTTAGANGEEAGEEQAVDLTEALDDSEVEQVSPPAPRVSVPPPVPSARPSRPPPVPPGARASVPPPVPRSSQRRREPEGAGEV